MKINLNIIKILFVVLLLGNPLNAVWLELCKVFQCDGCSDIEQDIKDAAEAIDERHEDLENNVSTKYKEVILNDNIEKIDLIEGNITQIIARINFMEKQANIDTSELIFLLRKNKELYTLPTGVGK